MRTAAWRDFAGDVKATGKRLKRVGKTYAKTHPLVVLGGGALLGALLTLTMRRRPKPESILDRIPKYGWGRYFHNARFWLSKALALAECAERVDRRR